MVNLSSFIRFHAVRTPDRLAIIFRKQRITYAEFLNRIETTAGLLRAQRIKPDEVVAVFMKNSAAFLEIAFAVSEVGAVLLPINFRLAAEEVRYISAHAGARLIFADAEFAPLLTDLVGVIVVDEAAQSNSTLLAAKLHPAPPQVRKPDDLFRLMYTSGTTDRPKGVIHTYANFFWKSADHVMALGLTDRSRLLVAGPLYHVGAFDLPGIAIFWVGGTIYLHRQFDPAEVLASIAAEALTCAWLAPVMTSALLAHPDRHRYNVSSLQWVIGGGERTPEERIRSFAQYFTSARYIDAYGLTESGSGDTLMEAGRELDKIGSVGRALPHVEIEIRDANGQPLPAGSLGEICLRGPKVTPGYWRDPEKTAAAFYGDWFRTGDLGHLDREGFLYITDRLKDMIISGGENIAASELERVILQLPEVREVAVVGLPDPKWGEQAVAVVVLNRDCNLDVTRLAEHCRTKLAPFKLPRRLIVRETLPRNPSGKVLKRLLRDMLRSSGDPAANASSHNPCAPNRHAQNRDPH